MQKRHDQGSFIEEMHGKVIVILNNKMKVQAREQTSADCLDAMEILKAAKDANVGTYVVGYGFDFKKAMMPLKSIDNSDETKLIEDRFMFWKKPSAATLQK